MSRPILYTNYNISDVWSNDKHASTTKLKASSIGRGFVREMPDRSNHEECLDMADEILAAYQEIAAVRQTERKKAAVSR